MSSTASSFPPSISPLRVVPELARQVGIAAAASCAPITSAWSAGTSSASPRPAWSRWPSPIRPRPLPPWGGRRQLYGTNPIAFACPRQGHAPIVVDLALSQVARGRILTAAQRGEPVPSTWATDEDGKPTSDAKAALRGALQPIGAAKGAALALMVEILAAGLTGATLSQAASSFFDSDGPPPAVGQLPDCHRSGGAWRCGGLGAKGWGSGRGH